MVGCDATGQSAPHKVRVRPALTDRRSLPRPLRPQQPAGLPGIAQSLREWVGFRSRLHHQNIAPNRSRLGVFVCGFPKPRGLRGRSACASRSARGWYDRPGSPLFRPIFSRNLRQLLRRGTRRRRFPSMVCACADGNGWLAGLLFQIARANPRDQPQRQPLGGNRS